MAKSFSLHRAKPSTKINVGHPKRHNRLSRSRWPKENWKNQSRVASQAKQKRWRGASHRDIAASWQNKQVVIPSMCECGLAEQPCDAQPTHGARHIRVLNVHHLLLLWILRGLDFVLQEGRAIFGGELLVDRVQNDLDFFSLPLHLSLSTISPVRR